MVADSALTMRTNPDLFPQKKLGDGSSPGKENSFTVSPALEWRLWPLHSGQDPSFVGTRVIMMMERGNHIEILKEFNYESEKYLITTTCPVVR